VLVSVDGEALRKMPQETVRSAIRGVAGTEVVLGLMRGGEGGRSVMIQVPLVREDAKKAQPHAVAFERSSAVSYEGVDRASVAYVEAERTRELEERVERQREEMRRKEAERRRVQQQEAEESRLR
jgi:C-terminal processing protease CtpA/Prc